MGWLQHHLETFVKPVLGYIPELSKGHARSFSAQEMSVIKNMWRAVKHEAKRRNMPLLLAGRDVFIWEILARREGYPTVFRPDISRLTVNHIKEDYSKHFLFDTGFMGSIPKALKAEAYTMGSSNSVGSILGGSKITKTAPWTIDPKQVFPRLTGARGLILKIERTPKYWKRAFYRDPATLGFFRDSYTSSTDQRKADPKTGIGQELSDPEEFLKAALLTIEIYKDSSPTFANERAPIKNVLITGTSYLD